MVTKRLVPKAPVLIISEEEVRTHISAGNLNVLLRAGFSLAVCNDNHCSIKVMVLLYGVALLANLLGTTTLAFLVWSGVFTLPIACSKKKAELTAAYSAGAVFAADLCTQLLAKLPKTVALKKM